MTQTDSVPKVPVVKFWPGNLYFTTAAERELVRDDIITALDRHGMAIGATCVTKTERRTKMRCKTADGFFQYITTARA